MPLPSVWAIPLRGALPPVILWPVPSVSLVKGEVPLDRLSTHSVDITLEEIVWAWLQVLGIVELVKGRRGTEKRTCHSSGCVTRNLETKMQKMKRYAYTYSTCNSTYII